jgi:organic hydroperoxide reductase OsmC/OhrA
METSYNYHANAQYHAGGREFVELEHSVPRTISFSAPPEFGGEPGLWTPEHFLLAAVASCFVATFRGVAKASKLEFQGIEVAIDGVIERDAAGLRFTKITVRPSLIIFDVEQRERALHLLQKVERICLIARSLSSTIELEPKILAEKPVAV